MFTTTGTSGRVTRQQQRASIAFAALKTKASSDEHDPKDNSTCKPKVRPRSLKLVPVSSGTEKRKQMAVTPYPVSLRLPPQEQQCKELVVASSCRGRTSGDLNKENINAAGLEKEHENPMKRSKKWPEDSYRVSPGGDNDNDKRVGNFPRPWSMNRNDNVSQFSMHFFKSSIFSCENMSVSFYRMTP